MCITKKRKGTKVVYTILTPYGYEATFDNKDIDIIVDEYNKLYNSYKSVCKYSDDLTKRYHNTKNEYIKEHDRLIKEINYLSNKDTFIMQHFIRPNGTKWCANNIEGLIDEIKYCYKVIERYSKELSKMEEKYDNRYEEIESLRKENEELKCNYDAISRNFDIVHEKNLKLEKENENERLTKEINYLSNNERLEKELEKAITSNNICVNRIKELGEELSEFKRPNSINEFKKTSTYINRLEAEMKTLEQNVVEYEKEVEVLKSENKDLKKELADVKDTLALARHDLDNVRNANSELETENENLKDELDAEKIATKYCVTDVLVTENNMLRIDNCELKQENEDLKAEIEVLKRKLKVCEWDKRDFKDELEELIEDYLG